MTDKLRQWIESEIKSRRNLLKELGDDEFDFRMFLSGANRALESVLQKDKEIEAEQPILDGISTVTCGSCGKCYIYAEYISLPGNLIYNQTEKAIRRACPCNQHVLVWTFEKGEDNGYK